MKKLLQVTTAIAVLVIPGAIPALLVFKALQAISARRSRHA